MTPAGATIGHNSPLRNHRSNTPCASQERLRKPSLRSTCGGDATSVGTLLARVATSRISAAGLAGVARIGSAADGFCVDLPSSRAERAGARTAAELVVGGGLLASVVPAADLPCGGTEWRRSGRAAFLVGIATLSVTAAGIPCRDTEVRPLP